jgi:adenylate cyclase
MEADEAGTIAALKARRNSVLAPLVSRHRGRVVKLMGDGVLVEFASAVNAVQCAIDLQQAMEHANHSSPPERSIVLRVGVNLGDVVVEDGDLFGDGVNVASRLEAMAEPGAVCISGSIHDQVKGKLKIAFEDIGRQRVKNISEPVQVYRIRAVEPAVQDKHRPAPEQPELAARASIAVLPFTNMSGDPEQTYFSDGITEDIITELSRFRSLFVIARHSSFAFRGQAMDAAEIARRLGVRYILEGSVRRAGPRVRVTAQLIDGITGNHLWAERYDRDLQDLFIVQDELTHAIVSTLAGRLEAAEITFVKRKRTGNMAAYDHLLRGIEHHQRFTLEDHVKAREHFQRAIDLDPQFAVAFAWLALAKIAEWDEMPPDNDAAFRLAIRAVELDGNESVCHSVLGFVYLKRRQFDKALAHTERAVALNPNFGHAIAHLGLIHTYMGDHEKGAACVESAIRLNPYHPDWYGLFLARAFYGMHRYSDAATQLSRLAGRTLGFHAFSAACYAQAGLIDDARRHAAEVLARRPSFHAKAYATNEVEYKSPADADHLLQGLLLAGLPE